jgi:O-antigen/teichoic acid export membrane protein
MQKQVLFNTAKLLVSRLIPAVVMTLINVIYSRALTPSDYGAYQTIWTYLNIFIILVTFGVPKYIITFGNSLSNENVKKLLRISVVLFLFALLLISIYLFLFSNYLDFYSRILFLFFLFFQTCYLIQEAFVIVENRSNKLIKYNTIYSAMLLIVHLIVIVLGYELSLCLLGIVIISIFRNLIIGVDMFQSGFWKRNSISNTMPNFSLLFWLGINDCLQIFTKWMDKLFLIFVLPVSEFAIYYNGTFEVPLIGTVLLAFQTIITINASKDQGGKQAHVELYKSSCLYMSGILFPLFSWMIWYSSSIVYILFGSKYAESATLFSLTALFLPMRICNYTVLLQLANKGKLILIGSVLDFVLSVTLMFVLYQIFKLNGLIMALVISTYFQAAFYTWKILTLYKVKLTELMPLQKLILRLIVVTCLIGGINYIGAFLLTPFYNFILGTIVTIVLIFFYIKIPFDFKDLKIMLGEEKS